MNENLLKYEAEKELQEHREHKEVLIAIAHILKTKEGLQLFTYLFKNLDVTMLPDRGMQANDLQEYLGFLRAGNSIYKLACEADSETSASIIAKLERKRYEDTYEQYRLEQQFTTETTKY